MYCMVLTACTEEEIPDNPRTESEGKVIVNFFLDIPSARSADDATDSNFYWERYIKVSDIRAFVYKDNKFQEEVKGLDLKDVTGQEQNEIREITGRLTNDYKESDNLQLVVLTNMNSRGVQAPATVTPNSSPADLYKQLIYYYAPATDSNAWNFSDTEMNYIPMWGISEKFTLANPDGMNQISNAITMYRAIAKIDIVVNDGLGLGADKGNFTIKKMELCNVPDQGYCASLNMPSPDDLQFATASFPKSLHPITDKTFTVYEASDATAATPKIENRIYVPEMGMYAPFPNFHIRIMATIYNKSREYIIYMRSNQTDSRTAFDIVRNHKYIINIRSVTSTEQLMVGYAVNSWGQQLETNLPPFN